MRTILAVICLICSTSVYAADFDKALNHGKGRMRDVQRKFQLFNSVYFRA